MNKALEKEEEDSASQWISVSVKPSMASSADNVSHRNKNDKKYINYFFLFIFRISLVVSGRLTTTVFPRI
jgi:hypothetical protein